MYSSEQSESPASAGLPLSGVRVAFFVEDEKTFVLPALRQAVRSLRERGAEVGHLALFPSKLGPHRGIRIPLWYLRTFGSADAFLLAGYKALESLRRARARFGPSRIPLSWDQLAARLGLRLGRFATPNQKAARDFLVAARCDILFIMVPYVLTPDVLRIPRIGTINKHAAILPGCRGLLPYFWSVVENKTLGVTFHQVVEEIDAGATLVQRQFGPPSSSSSMLHFYRAVFLAYPEMACQAAEALVHGGGHTAPPDPGTYYSLPARKDYLDFRWAGGKVARFRDLRRGLAP
jgi:hypothetical protein